MSRTANTAISKENELIIKAGWYTHLESRQPVYLADAIHHAKRSVSSYDPASTQRLANATYPAAYTTRISVTPETTSAAFARLASSPSSSTSPSSIAVLNFASARHPGGGYLTGATAQEEDICRSSALYTTLLAAPDFYAAHKRSDGTYTHRVIWSPDVPVFRDPSGILLPKFYTVNFVTAAAPNVYSMEKHGVSLVGLKGLLRDRAARILAVCAENGARVLVLGAWGCGVFRNDPEMVGKVFKELLEGKFKGVFEEVVFAVYDRSASQATIAAFKSTFG